MAGNTITQTKYNELQAELDYRSTTKRKEISDAIKVAREFGDLSENAEYSAAKNEQEANEIEIERLKGILSDAIIMDESAINTKTISIGNVVTVLDLEENEEVTYTLVSTLEANSRELKISDKSPIGKALVGHSKGETVYAQTPAGPLGMKIVKISK
ncbi:MAG: transcription elongation factor GreA [Clostridia bacterium]|nr:transcription elongation factor GreA [Clostridia bacterium]